MLNTMRLDCLGIKYYWPRVLLYMVFSCLIGFIDPVLIIPVMALQMLYMSNYTFMAEEKGRLEHLYFMLPISRKTTVKARFALVLAMQLVGIVIGVIATMVIAAILNGRSLFSSLAPDAMVMASYQPHVRSMALLICASLLACSYISVFMFPILYRLGYAKGKIWGVYIPAGVLAVPVFLFAALMGYTVGSGGMEPFGLSLAAILPPVEHWWLALILFAAAALLCALSYVLSQRIYAKREF